MIMVKNAPMKVKSMNETGVNSLTSIPDGESEV